MKTNIKSITFVLLAALFGLSGCKKTEFAFGDLTTPSAITLTTAVAGVDAANPAGNGTGAVTITVAAANAITYKVDFGDGTTKILPSGTITYKYSSPGTFDYTVSAVAIGTGGTASTLSKKITVFVNFTIPADILQSLTNGSSQTWVTDKEVVGHFGVGPITDDDVTKAFSPVWYAATPNERAPEAYDDEITFRKDALNNIYMTVDNKGLSFIIGAATSFYGFSGGDGVYPLDPGGEKKLAFMNATSASTSAVSTRIQFTVPGNGIVNFGTGGVTYEILSISATSIYLRSIGADGNAWYQRLKVKA